MSGVRARTADERRAGAHSGCDQRGAALRAVAVATRARTARSSACRRCSPAPRTARSRTRSTRRRTRSARRGPSCRTELGRGTISRSVTARVSRELVGARLGRDWQRCEYARAPHGLSRMFFVHSQRRSGRPGAGRRAGVRRTARCGRVEVWAAGGRATTRARGGRHRMARTGTGGYPRRKPAGHVQRTATPTTRARAA